MFARIPGKGITLEMYIRNTQVNKKKKKTDSLTGVWDLPIRLDLMESELRSFCLCFSVCTGIARSTVMAQLLCNYWGLNSDWIYYTRATSTLSAELYHKSLSRF